MFESLVKFVNYWYFRYLLVTELYMVEKWERIMIHIVFFIIFSIVSLINSTVILGLISYFNNNFFGSEILSTNNLIKTVDMTHTEL